MAAAVLVACSQPGAGPPANLTLTQRADGRFFVEGGPVRLSGAHTTTIELVDSPRASPLLQIGIVGCEGAREESVVAVVDTGSDGALRLSATARHRVKPWVWDKSKGKVRVWALGGEGASLGACASVRLGDAMLRGVPAEFPAAPGRDAEPLSAIGLGILRCWKFVAFDWRRSRLTLSDDSADTEGERVPFRPWRPLPGNDMPPFIVVDGMVADHPVQLMLDTGFEADLSLAASLCSRPPWKDALESRGESHARTAGDAKPIRVHRLLRPLTLAGRTFEGLTVVEFDDSSAPVGAEMMPIAGAPLLRRFGTFTIDFRAEQVVFGQD